jgi:hypothetical protein
VGVASYRQGNPNVVVLPRKSTCDLGEALTVRYSTGPASLVLFRLTGGRPRLQLPSSENFAFYTIPDKILSQGTCALGWFRFFFFWAKGGFGLRSSCTPRTGLVLTFQARSVAAAVTRCLPEKSPAAHSFLFSQQASCLQFYGHVFAGRGLDLS